MMSIHDRVRWARLWSTLCVLAFLFSGGFVCHGQAPSQVVTAPAEGPFVIQVQQNPSTGYTMALKGISDGIYFLYTDPPTRPEQPRLGAPSVRTFHFFSALGRTAQKRGEVVFAQFRPFDFDRTYAEQRYTVRIAGAGFDRPRRALGIYVRPSEGGLGVLSVQPGSIAQDLGIQPRDLVTHVNGQQVSTLSQLHAAMDAIGSNQVFVRLRRRGKYLDLTTTQPDASAQNSAPFGGQMKQRNASQVKQFRHAGDLRRQTGGGGPRQMAKDMVKRP